MKVKPVSPVKYNDKPYGIGEEFEIDEKTFAKHKDLFEVVREEGKEPENPLAKFTVPVLKRIAKESGIEGYANMKKDELILAISSLEGDDDGQHGNPEGKAGEKDPGQDQ